jgi:hypothetical protein
MFLEVLFHFSEKWNKNGGGNNRKKITFIRLFSPFIRPFWVVKGQE